MAKRKGALGSKTKDGKTEITSGIRNLLVNRGAGTSALIPDNLDEQIANNPEQLVKELSSHFAMIPLSQIEANPDQPRRHFEKEALEELADSIRIHGIIQPITVRRLADKQYQIISGERRWRASKLAELVEVPAFIRIANDQTLMEMALIENIQREDLNPIDIAVGYHRLKDEFSLTDEQLAERVGKKRTTVTNYRRLLELHPDVIEALRGLQLSMGHARVIAGIEDKFLQKDLLREIISKELSVRDTEKLGKRYKPEAQKPTAKNTAPRRLSVEHEQILDDFRSFFEHKNIKMLMDGANSQKGQIIIHFDSNDQLHNLFKCIEQS